MADIYHTAPDGASIGLFQTGRLGRLTHFAGAAVSIAVLVGVGVWGTKMIIRDVSGIPVVEAIEGPMRVAPDNPGGSAADHQGLAVNDVAGHGIAAAPADRLRLAPPPVTLAEEDVVLAAMPQPAAVADAPAVVAEPELDDPGAAIRDLADRMAAVAEPFAPLDAAPSGSPEAREAEDAPALETAEADADLDASLAVQAALSEALGQGGLARSLRPRKRPQEGVQLASLSVPAAVTQVAARPDEVDPDTIPDGTRLVQLGAFDSAETARGEWARIEGRFSEYLAGKSRVIQKAASGGKTFYRLRAMGFEDISDARRFCAALVAGRTDCIPVAAR